MLNELILCRYGQSDKKGDFQTRSNNEYIVERNIYILDKIYLFQR